MVGEAGRSAEPTMLGQVLDERYRIVGVLGRGGIGIVYRAQQTHVHDREVAIKILNAVASARASTATRFENEARIIAQLRHPNTLKLIDTGRTPDGRLYIVTECLHGEPLSERLQRGALGAMETVRLVQQIAEALTEAHEKGVIHRDLKPANVFLERVGSQMVVKVLDFGIAKMVSAAALTAPMQIFGTPGFMAPEQCLGHSADPRSDLYALGVIAYLCLSLEMPVEEDSVEALLAATIDVPAIPLRHRMHDIDPELEGLVMQLLAKDPGDRLPDAMAVRDACGRLMRMMSNTDPVPIPSASQVDLQAWSEDDLEAATAAATPPTSDPRYQPTPDAPTPDFGTDYPEGDPAAPTTPVAVPDVDPTLRPMPHVRVGGSAREARMPALPLGSEMDDDPDAQETLRGAPNDTRILGKDVLRGVVPAAGDAEVSDDSLDAVDVAPTIPPTPSGRMRALSAAAARARLRALDPASQPPPPRPHLGRNVLLGLLSALVAASLASGVLYLLGKG